MAPTLARELRYWASFSELMSWDESTYLPKNAVSYRGELKAFAVARHYELLTSSEMKAHVDRLAETKPEQGGWDAADLRIWSRQLLRANKLSKDLVTEIAEATTSARNLWLRARAEKSFSILEPALTRVVALKREEGKRLDPTNPYQALLEQWEPGMSVKELEGIFEVVGRESRRWVEAIGKSKIKPDLDVLKGDYPIPSQRKLAEEAAQLLGFDFQSGRLDETAHPFCMRLGPSDVRMTTRYSLNDFADSFFSVLHETGHGLYEQALPQERYFFPSGGYCSLGIHESQSRFWENAIGRSEGFWKFFLPKAKQAFPIWAGVSLRDFVLAINRVKPTFIRVKADELTYNLHILIRFQIEKDLIEGRLEVSELPERWNQEYREILGISPKDDAEGCLQDIHWSYGMFGYFPTYTLGNFYAAQFFEAVEEKFDVQTLLSAGQFKEIREWLRSHIHCEGSRYTAKELCERVTGATLSTAPFLRYLSKKFGPMFEIS